MTDTNGLNLSEFDEVVENTANIDYRVHGNQLVITPNANSKESGVLTLKKSAGTALERLWLTKKPANKP